MALPGYTGDVSLYRTSGSYGGSPRRQPRAAVIAALIDPGCLESCYHNCNWDCFELIGAARGACLRECREVALTCRQVCTVASCVPSTTCYPDPATPDGRCQICYRDNCDGTGSVWHTC
jgi:hypothetical protein